jgi:hypothetical protein
VTEKCRKEIQKKMDIKAEYI